ncbi:hypothetical protein TCON_2091 [Astathelohania contejeani]|uniref:Kinetochore protein Spc24 n=1 Tax=Astathelohania contejeani TaxID=164912 RepID=A0ABQ7HX37_9MICR|nr:hypothetical protein TCON_2091 [Thelohania contejeani]
MDEPKALLNEMFNLFNRHKELSILKSIENTKKEKKKKLETTVKNTTESLDIINRKNEQIEMEVRRLKHIRAKNGDNFNKLNNERLVIAKKLIETEDDCENLQNKITDTERKIIIAEENLKKHGLPTLNGLFLEIAKGFNVEWVNKNGLKCKIRSKRKNDIFEIAIKDGISKENEKKEICDKIWNLL